VEDLVQEVLIAIHRKRASYAPGLPFTAWLHGIARHRLIDHFRREGRRVTVPLGDVAELQDPGDAERAMAAADLETLLATLPAKQAAAIRLTRISGYSVSEAAAQSGQSVSSVKVNVHRGLGRLIARINGKG
jgi:RNA polymerase sigma-70 factor (ECF subfamily)